MTEEGRGVRQLAEVTVTGYNEKKLKVISYDIFRLRVLHKIIPSDCFLGLC